MARDRVTLTIEVDLEPTPGTFHTAESARDVIQSFLEWNVGAYNPKVRVVFDTKEEFINEVSAAFDRAEKRIIEEATRSENEERTCEAMHWFSENHGVQCILPWGHELEGVDEHDFERK